MLKNRTWRILTQFILWKKLQEWKSLRVEEKKKVKCEITKLQNRKSPALLMNATGVKKVEHCWTLGDFGESVSIKHKTNIKHNCIDQFKYQKNMLQKSVKRSNRKLHNIVSDEYLNSFFKRVGDQIRPVRY